MIEKFLYSIPEVAKIFILIRGAKGKSGVERWAEITKSTLFNRVHSDFPERLAKIVPVEGDITVDEMGLSEEDLASVLGQTSVVIHCAATVRFNDSLRSAIELNVKGVNRMIKLCKRMPKLESFLHCSTCYVNVDKQDEIEEQLYPVVCDPHKLMEAQEWLSDEMLDGITKQVTKKYFNTYCFTKHVAEELVKRECADLPTLIFRPSIIAGIWKDGIPGWADAFQGITANALGFVTGTIPRMPCDTSFPLDIVPVDVVTNMMITCAAYRLHLTAIGDRSMPVFHCNTSHLNPVSAGFYRDICGSWGNTYPVEKFIFSPSAGSRGTAPFENSVHDFKRRVAGPALDRMGALMGKKPFWERTLGKVQEVYQIFVPFVSKRWIYKSDNMTSLICKMQPEDADTFYFDVRTLDWTDYLSDVLFGMRTFLLKNDLMSDEKLSAVRARVRIHQGIEFFVTILLAWFLSLIATRDFSSWSVAAVIFLPLYIYFNCNTFTWRPIGSIESYRKRMSASLQEPPTNNNKLAN